MTRVPLVDLAWQHHQIAEEVAEGFERVIAKGSFIQGEEAAAFEMEFASFCGVPHCVGVGNGTDALEFSLRAAGIGTGDEVLVPANTFIASAEAVVRAGATPIFVECEPGTHLIDVDQVAGRLTGSVRAVIPVHLYGQLAAMDELESVLAGSDVVVIEDAAQAQGATRHGRGIGQWGIAAATSFYPGKNLGAYGDAGAVLTTDDQVARRSRRLGNHGSDVKYEHPSLGFNSRLDGLQAVVLRAKLARLAGWNDARRQAAARYDRLLGHLSESGVLKLPITLPGNSHVWHLYVVEVADRDEVVAGLQQAGVAAGIHYPVPVHLQGAFRSSAYSTGSFPIAERAAAQVMSLPIYPGITGSDQERVAEVLGGLLLHATGAPA